MHIKITDCKYTPSWVTLQQMVREAKDDHSCTLINIQRHDNGIHYRGLGKYKLTMRKIGGYIENVELEVES
jgi:hypothetical protein